MRDRDRQTDRAGERQQSRHKLVSKFRLCCESSDCFDVFNVQLELPIHSVHQQHAERLQVFPWKGELAVLHVASVSHKEIMELKLWGQDKGITIGNFMVVQSKMAIP